MDIELLRAASHPFRKHIIEQLANGSQQTTSELSEGFNMTKAAVSQHLKLLRDSHMVLEEKRGRTKYYALNPTCVQEVLDWAQTFENFWSARLHSLNDYLRRQAATHDPQNPDPQHNPEEPEHGEN